MKLKIKIRLMKKDSEKKAVFFLLKKKMTHSLAAAPVGHSPVHKC